LLLKAENIKSSLILNKIFYLLISQNDMAYLNFENQSFGLDTIWVEDLCTLIYMTWLTSCVQNQAK